MAEQKQKKNRLAEDFTKDYKYEGLVLLLLSIIAIILGGYFLVDCYTLDPVTNEYGQPFGDAFFLGTYPKVFSWLLTGLGAVSFLLSIWPYYKPSIYEIKRVSWPSKKVMLENAISTFVFSAIMVLFFFLVDSALLALIDWINSFGIRF